MLDRLTTFVERVTAWPARRPWVGPAAMMVVGFGALIAAWLVQPGAGEWSYLFGRRFGGECGFVEATGLACPSCGMTRSWVWLARGDVLKALSYNAAGAMLLLSLVGMGLLGAVRLLTRSPKRWALPFRWISAGVVMWLLGPYLALWLVRLVGYYPLPPLQ